MAVQPRPRTPRPAFLRPRHARHARRAAGSRPAQRPRTRLVAAVGALALVGTLGAVAPFAAPAAAAATTVALVGDLQSELGCPGDWQPDCAATELAPTGVPGQFAADVTVPGGTWQYKVALNDSWDESYGREGGADNAPLVLGGETRLRVVYDDTTHRTALAPLDLAADYTAADDALVAAPVRETGADESFYFVMTDRFADGDTTNNSGGLTGDRLTTGLDPTDKGFYHGGDIAGLRDQLRLHPGPGHDGDLAHPVVQEPPGSGHRSERLRRLPRLLDHRLHADRPAPGHERRASRPSSPRPTTAGSRSTSTSSPTTPPT